MLVENEYLLNIFFVVIYLNVYFNFDDYSFENVCFFNIYIKY